MENPRLKRLQFRAWHRGTREADYMIGCYFDRFHSTWGEVEIAWFDGIALVVAGANRREAYEVAFADFQRAKVDAVFVLISIANFANRHTISELAIRHRMATVHNNLGEMEAGGLLSYGADFLALRRGAAHYVDRILKGAKPADLPVQRPTTFVLGLNLKTARSIGRTIPQPLLLRADRTIE